MPLVTRSECEDLRPSTVDLGTGGCTGGSHKGGNHGCGGRGCGAASLFDGGGGGLSLVSMHA